MTPVLSRGLKLMATVELHNLHPNLPPAEAARIAYNSFPNFAEYVMPVDPQDPERSILIASNFQKISGNCCRLRITSNLLEWHTVIRIQQASERAEISRFIFTPTDPQGGFSIFQCLALFKAQMPQGDFIAPLPLPCAHFSQEHAIVAYNRLVRSGCTGVIAAPEYAPKYWAAFVKIASHETGVVLPVIQAVRPVPIEQVADMLSSDMHISQSIRTAFAQVMTSGARSTEAVARNTLMMAKLETSARSIPFLGAYLDVSQLPGKDAEGAATHIVGRHQ